MSLAEKIFALLQAERDRQKAMPEMLARLREEAPDVSSKDLQQRYREAVQVEEVI